MASNKKISKDKISTNPKASNTATTPIRDVFVINRMFAGSYLHNNIGHEFINLYKDDKDRNYVYIMPQGTFDLKKYSNHISHVFMVRGIKNMKAVEVLALATIKDDVYSENCKDKESQEKYIQKNDIRYADVLLSDIFKTSKQQDIDISLKASSVRRPNNRIFLLYDKSKQSGIESIAGKDVRFIYMGAKQAKASLKQYIKKEDANYNELENLIKDSSLWSKDLEKLPKDYEIKEDNFFEVCGIEDYELAFSNALAYFLHKYPQDVVDFARIRGNKINEFNEILREWNNIDLLLKNDDLWIVIENKITSKINGKLVKVGNKNIGDQLQQYYKIVTKEIENFSSKPTLLFYLLTPDYNPIKLSDYNILPDFVCDSIYKTITYSQIYAFIKDKHNDDPYFQEFVKGIEKHTREYYNDLFEDMKNKIFKELRKLKQNKE